MKEINFNTFAVGMVAMLLAVIGFLGKTQLEDIKSEIKASRALIMPREEIMLQLLSVKVDAEKIESQMKDFRMRMDSLELEIIRLKKP